MEDEDPTEGDDTGLNLDEPPWPTLLAGLRERFGQVQIDDDGDIRLPMEEPLLFLRPFCLEAGFPVLYASLATNKDLVATAELYRHVASFMSRTAFGQPTCVYLDGSIVVGMTDCWYVVDGQPESVLRPLELFLASAVDQAVEIEELHGGHRVLGLS